MPRRTLPNVCYSLLTCLTLAVFLEAVSLAESPKYDATQAALAELSTMKVAKGDWPQWGGWCSRNNVPKGSGIPHEWDVESGKNIKWTTKLGSQTYGNAVIANGKVYIGTNNGAAYVSRFPERTDLGCLLCFDVGTGKFLWQHSSTKLPTGAEHDWPQVGICCAPLVDGDRLWFVTSRGEVRCLDTEGFRDGENDGPFTSEDNENKDEADVIWVLDMMGKLGVSQHNMAACSVTAAGDLLFVLTSNGVDESHVNLPAPDAPSFLALNRNTGEVVWTDKSPGTNILHGQWSSPAYAVLGGQPQVLFAGGDGWLYSFSPEGDGNGNSKLLWKFDCNPKESKWIMGGRGTRNSVIGTPVAYDGRVYLATGQDPEHGEGTGHLWCIDPTKRGDVSSELAVGKDGKPIPPRRIQAVDPDAGEKAIPNPNSAAIWHYSQCDLNGDGKFDFEEEMHRTIGTPAIKDDILYIADISGLFHCVDARTGKRYWIHDMFAVSWSSALIVDGKVYIADEDGEVTVFQHGREKKMLAEISMDDTIYGTPVIANNILFLPTRSALFAIEQK